jgi:rhodanese-related sulfurtransferase
VHTHTNTLARTHTQECHELCKSGDWTYLDVRTAEEYAALSPEVLGRRV